MRAFEPHPLLRNPDLMTLAGAFNLRRYPRLPSGAPRRFRVDAETEVLAFCHWQREPRRHPTLIVLHGLEGSVESSYMLGTAEKAYAAGFNAIRLNQRNCGGTEHLTTTLYNSGLSCDSRAVVLELVERDALPEIFVCGYSMGGNLVLKMAGEFGPDAPPQLRAAVGVAPAIDLGASADSIDRRRNFIYQQHFIRGLMSRFRRKMGLFPERYRLDGIGRVRTIRGFDDVITAPAFGFHDADDYYHRSSALRVIERIAIPTLILASEDDTFVPFATFQRPELAANLNITVLASEHGGHCSFISAFGGEERFWAEARTVEFCREKSEVRT
jgi:predicted alpha/beta-fold hydrolase